MRSVFKLLVRTHINNVVSKSVAYVHIFLEMSLEKQDLKNFHFEFCLSFLFILHIVFSAF